MKRRLLKIVLWGGSIIIFLVLIGFVVNRYGRNKCQSVQITINAPSDCTFLTEEEVRTYIRQSRDSLAGSDLSKIDIEKLESIINKKPYVLNSKVYMSINGILKIDIIQRTPIARIQNIYDSSYYISDDGRLMPLTKGKTARVVFVNGEIKNMFYDFLKLDVDSAQIAEDTSGFLKRLYTIYNVAKFINQNKFFKAQIQQIFVEKNGNLVLVPEVGNHIIIFGDGNNISEKFRRLEIFYEKAPFIQGWDKYDTINIKYNNQIICS